MVCDTRYLQNEFGDSRFFFFFFNVFDLILSFYTSSQSFNKICTWEVLDANVLNNLAFAVFNPMKKNISTRSTHARRRDMERDPITCFIFHAQLCLFDDAGSP